jgi:hypothetical protein
MDYILIDGTVVTRAQIEAAFVAGKARLVHGRRDNGTSTGLSLDGKDIDTRGECYNMWEEVWTGRPKSISQALSAAQC